MLNRFATLAAVCMLVPVAAAPLAVADPDPGPPPPDGAVFSAPPGITTSPEGYTVSVAATNETEVSVPPLSTALSSREYIVGGTFTSSAKGTGSTKRSGATLEAGYQIGCGISLDRVELIFGAGVNPSFNGATGALASVAFPINFAVEIELLPGSVTIVPVTKKTTKGNTDPRVNIGNFHVKVDGCVGQSFMRSYATLTSSTDANDTVVSYVGVTKAV